MTSTLRYLLALTIAFVAFTAPSFAQPLRIYYPDIEQGSSTLIVSPTGKAVLVDGGTGLKVTDVPIEDFINDLVDAGIVTSLDAIIATHYDEDHIGRLENVFDQVPLSPGFVAYDRGEFGSLPSTFAYSDYVFRANANNRTTITPTTLIDLGGGVTVRSYVVNGDLPDGTSEDISASGQFENSASITVVVQYGDFDVWIGGDLTGNPSFGVADVESAVAPFVGDVDVYTFNHHGSRSSSNANLLDTLQAEVGINQNAVTNNFGHPNTEVVNRFLGTLDSNGATPLFFQQNPGDPGDTRSDDSLASGIADCDDASTVGGLPGTITLLSDGSSYQISSCGFGRLSFAADSGSGVIGDFPPAITQVTRTPLVPTSAESVTVDAVVSDDGGSPTVEIDWSLDGVSQAPIAMTLSGGVYSGVIPAQNDGVRVGFRVRATDSASQSELSREHGFYSGTTPIDTLRSNDADGILQYKHYAARIVGNVTAEPGIFHPFVSQIYVEDASSGVSLFDSQLLALARGDLVEAIGEIEQFGGATELNTSESFGNIGVTFLSTGTPPAPTVLTVAQAGEAYEGQLVRINGVTVLAGSIPETGSGNLTISDDGGVSTLTLRVDGDTDIPGSNTPTQAFDVIGMMGQFDSLVPYSSGYQILPRERTDLLTDEINHPDVLIAEILADPPSGTPGDANGDGTRSATDDEFVELVNTSFVPADISGWTLSDGVSVRHTFPSGTVIPAREATVVFGGGTPTGDFGNAAANGLVFTASSGRLSLNNAGDTVTLADDQGTPIQVVVYGSEGGQDESLVRDPDWSNAPFVQHGSATGSAGTAFSPGTRISGQAYTVGVGALLLTEVMYDATGADDGLEWFELYNPTGAPIELDDLCVGNGGGDYTNSVVQLAGTVAAGETFVVGGAVSSGDNGNPLYDQVADFSPDFQNSGTDADATALFNVRCSQVTPTTVPIDAVVYGTTNTDGFLDETGVAAAPEVGDAPSGATIERTDLAGSWQIQVTPNPNFFDPNGPPPPPPAAGLLLSEVMYNPSGSDDGLEWVEIYNPTANAVDLSGWSLGNGGSDYTYSQIDLSGTIAAGATFVVGGPTSSSSNGNPTYDQVANFSPDFQNSGSTADGVALFNLTSAQVTATTVPVDAVIYGSSNTNGLIDETGIANPPEVGNAPTAASIERSDLAGSWQIQSNPTPNTTPLAGGDITPPAAPTGLAATAGDGSVSLDWADNGEGDLAGYNVFRATTSGGPYSQVNGALVTPSDYVDNAVTNGTTYYYVVTAVDTSSNESGNSNEASATPQGAGGPTSMHVASIVLSTTGGGNPKGRAVVTVIDDLGGLVSGVTVNGTFTGSYSESGSATTDGSGEATLTTSGRSKNPSFTFCVDSVTGGSLSYDAGSNVESCDSY